MSALRQKQTCARKRSCLLFPQKRPQKRISAQGHVCFTPKSGRVQRSTSCPLWAISGPAVTFWPTRGTIQGLPQAQEYPAHGAIHGPVADALQRLLGDLEALCALAIP